MNNKNKTISVVILGAGRHGKEVASYIQDLRNQGEKIELIGFIDEVKPKIPFAQSNILGNFEDLSQMLKASSAPVYYLSAAGDNFQRLNFIKKIEALRSPHLRAWSLRHPAALTGQAVEIGGGCCLAPRSVITTYVKMGNHCILNVGASISHDCVIGDFVNINPGAVICGDVRIGEGCYIGAGATIIDKVSIGEWSIIGAGAVVTQDIPSHVTAVGVPAKVIKSHPVPA